MPLRALTAVGVFVLVATVATAQPTATQPTETPPPTTPSAQTQPTPTAPAQASPAEVPPPPAPAATATPPADTAIASLRWTRLDGAGGCIDAHDLAARVEQLMAEPVWATSSAGRFTVRGWVIRRIAPMHGFVAEVTLVAPDGRALQRQRMSTDAGNCRVLDDMIGQVIATGLAFAPPSFEVGHPESGSALSTPRLFLDFNPYMGPPERYWRASSSERSRTAREGLLPNPYATHPLRLLAPDLCFNPYTASGPHTVVATVVPPSMALRADEPAGNPYYTSPASETVPGFNPYRP